MTSAKPRVRLLPENLINRIAAGEVVERPASILKELLENSLDAGADNILIEVLEGGKRLIRVTDNGCGMGEEDLFMSLERHATSKLSSDSDLMNISTLGFRGEALPSISSVARLAVTSAVENGEGRVINIAGGRLEGMSPVAANKGTVVEVRDLFFNVPARKKFLKSDQTESAHMQDVAQHYALSREGLSLCYREGVREIFSVDARHDFKNRVYRLWGREAATDLKPFEYELESLKIKGWLGGAQSAQSSSAGLFTYVLGRPVKDRLLNRALTSGYGRILPAGKWPKALIFIEIDPYEVDVNVHPAKTEVRFRHPSLVFQSLSQAVARAVGEAPLSAQPTPDYRDYTDIKFPKTGAPSDRLSNVSPQAETFTFSVPVAEDAAKQPLPPWMREAGAAESAPGQAEAAPYLAPSSPPAAQAARAMEPTIDEAVQPLGQLDLRYILARGPQGLYIIDQHAAHERILFNQLKARLAQDGLAGQQLLFPETFDLPPHQVLAAEILAPRLARLGFDLSHFGGRSFVLKSAPAILKGHDPWPVVLEILSAAQGLLKELEVSGGDQEIEAVSDRWLYSLACRAALKSGYKMSLEEMNRLLADLAIAQLGGFCPHGRPSVMVVSVHDLDRRFGRI